MAQRNMTTSEFVEKAKIVHGDTYDYSKSVYEATVKPVTIVCHKHGEFLQSPKSHLSGRGCKICGDLRKTLTTENFVTNAIETHGTRYDYSKVVYVNALTKVKILCSNHGEFYQTPNRHISGNGCPKCARYDRAKMRLRSVEEFKTMACDVHGKVYDYSNVIYRGAYTNVEIVCKHHGVFNQTPNNHLQGNGCPKCSKYGFNPVVDGNVYTLISECGNFIKIGITGDTKRRFKELRNSTPFRWSVLNIEPMSGEDAKRVEKERHSLSVNAGFVGFDGCSEWFINPCK